MSNGFLDQAYDSPEDGDARRLYAAWASSYEDELTSNGYAAPARVAAALAKHAPDRSVPLLDYGCGTGLSGLALRDAGFTCIDGLDITAEMLAVAQGKALYRRLTLADPAAAPPVTPGDYAIITGIGLIGIGAAPLSMFDTIMGLLGPGGLFAFSLNDHALADRRFEAKINEWLDCGAARLLVRDYGPHIPGKGLGANIYILEKA